jgi:Ala-tRNA(Pro) deacylase
MVPDQIRNYLDEHRVPYRTTTHPYGVTAQETAQRVHVSGKRFGKTVVLKQGGNSYVMAVIPADESVNISALRDMLGPGVELATEEELGRLFPECEAGAMPPLGGLYGLPVLADACLEQQATITVNGGTHTDVIEIRWEDFVQAEHPRIITH